MNLEYSVNEGSGCGNLAFEDFSKSSDHQILIKLVCCVVSSICSFGMESGSRDQFRDRASVDSKMLPSLRSLFRVGDFGPQSEQCGELVEDCNFGSKKCACISGDFL